MNLLAVQSTLRFAHFIVNISKLLGNEQKISLLMDIFNKYWIMVNESIKKDDKFKANFIIFLILNGNFEGNDLLEVKEYWHLVNFIPKLSSLLISKIILHLDLNVVYCSTISIIPIQVNLKLTHEIMLNLKYVEPRKSLKELVIILETEIKLFPTIDACHVRIVS